MSQNANTAAPEGVFIFISQKSSEISIFFFKKMGCFVLQQTYPQCEDLGQDLTEVTCQACAFFRLRAKGNIAVPVCSQVELLHPTSFELQFQRTLMGMQYWKNI